MSGQSYTKKGGRKEALPEARQIETYANGLRLLARMIARHHAAAKWLRYDRRNHEDFVAGNMEQPQDEESCC